MSPNTSDDTYIKAIYDVALDKNRIDWKDFLHELIDKEGLDPWDIDLSILTKKYLAGIRKLPRIDFDVSGKFLTIAVFLLKIKAENYIERDLRGIEEKIASVRNPQNEENMFDQIGSLEEFDNKLEDIKKRREKYELKLRNPLARKRKVNIFDLINVLEKTFEQNNKRRANFFARNREVEYEGPMYARKEKDLKQIIEELYETILSEFENKQGHIYFHHLVEKKSGVKEVLQKFIPLLHLHTQEKVTVKQHEHFGDIEIHKINKGKNS